MFSYIQSFATTYPYISTVIVVFIVWVIYEIVTAPTMPECEEKYNGEFDSSYPNDNKSRCCGRCDGINDICIGDTICDKHNITGCEECYFND